MSRLGITPDFTAKLESELQALEQLSGTQDSALAPLSASTRAYCEAKGRLYNLTKDIISAGQALHAAGPEAAAQYNSKLLYRRPSRGKAEADPRATTRRQRQ